MPTILITGANRGLGLELVRQYAQAGWQIIATCRNPDQADALKALATLHSTIEILPLDVAKFVNHPILPPSLNNKPIDVLLHNAGVYGGGSRQAQTLEAVTPEVFHETFQTNALGPLFLTRALLPNIRLGGRKLIAIVSSKVGSISDNILGGGYAYRTSKVALNMLMKNVAIDTQDEHINVLLLHPGWVQTDMGGSNALIDETTSVSGMRHVIEEKGSTAHADFYDYQGNRIEW